MPDPTFSISMPIGAYHPFLEDALKSLIAQDAAVEIAFLDASGDPRVKEIAERFDARIAYRRHGWDNGQSDAIIEGWANTRGTLLGWLNADDILFPHALGTARHHFSDNQAIDLVYAHSTIIDDAGDTVSYHWAVEPDPARITEGGIISQPSCFFKRDAYDAIGGLDPDLHYTMDWDLWIRLYENKARFHFIDDVFSKVLWAQGTKTSSFNKTRRDELRRLISRHAPASKKKSIMRSFAIHNMIDRVPTQTARNAITRALIRGRKTIRGISGDARLSDKATLPLVHYNDQEKTKIVVTAENCRSIKSLHVNGVRAQRSSETRDDTKNEVSFQLGNPVSGNTLAEVSFGTDGSDIFLTKIGLR